MVTPARPAILLLLSCALCAAYPAQPSADQEVDSEETRKVLGSSVVTSVSVIMDLGNGSQKVYTDPSGNPVDKPVDATNLASPPSMMNPDRYEFYTFNDAGDLVKRLMTLEEIQSLIAGESVEIGSDLPGYDQEEQVDEKLPAFFFLPRPIEQTQDWSPPAVDNVVAKVQNVLAAMRNSTVNGSSNEPSWTFLPSTKVSDSVTTETPMITEVIPNAPQLQKVTTEKVQTTTQKVTTTEKITTPVKKTPVTEKTTTTVKSTTTEKPSTTTQKITTLATKITTQNIKTTTPVEKTNTPVEKTTTTPVKTTSPIIKTTTEKITTEAIKEKVTTQRPKPISNIIDESLQAALEQLAFDNIQAPLLTDVPEYVSINQVTEKITVKPVSTTVQEKTTTVTSKPASTTAALNDNEIDSSTRRTTEKPKVTTTKTPTTKTPTTKTPTTKTPTTPTKSPVTPTKSPVTITTPGKLPATKPVATTQKPAITTNKVVTVKTTSIPSSGITTEIPPPVKFTKSTTKAPGVVTPVKSATTSTTTQRITTTSVPVTKPPVEQKKPVNATTVKIQTTTEASPNNVIERRPTTQIVADFIPEDIPDTTEVDTTEKVVASVAQITTLKPILNNFMTTSTLKPLLAVGTNANKVVVNNNEANDTKKPQPLPSSTLKPLGFYLLSTSSKSPVETVTQENKQTTTNKIPTVQSTTANTPVVNNVKNQHKQSSVTPIKPAVQQKIETTLAPKKTTTQKFESSTVTEKIPTGNILSAEETTPHSQMPIALALTTDRLSNIATTTVAAFGTVKKSNPQSSTTVIPVKDQIKVNNKPVNNEAQLKHSTQRPVAVPNKPGFLFESDFIAERKPALQVDSLLREPIESTEKISDETSESTENIPTSKIDYMDITSEYSSTGDVVTENSKSSTQYIPIKTEQPHQANQQTSQPSVASEVLELLSEITSEFTSEEDSQETTENPSTSSYFEIPFISALTDESEEGDSNKNPSSETTSVFNINPELFKMPWDSSEESTETIEESPTKLPDITQQPIIFSVKPQVLKPYRPEFAKPEKPGEFIMHINTNTGMFETIPVDKIPTDIVTLDLSPEGVKPDDYHKIASLAGAVNAATTPLNHEVYTNNKFVPTQQNTAPTTTKYDVNKNSAQSTTMPPTISPVSVIKDVFEKLTTLHPNKIASTPFILPESTTKPQAVQTHKPVVQTPKPQPVYTPKPQPVYTPKPQPVYTPKPQASHTPKPPSVAPVFPLYTDNLEKVTTKMPSKFKPYHTVSTPNGPYISSTESLETTESGEIFEKLSTLLPNDSKETSVENSMPLRPSSSEEVTTVFNAPQKDVVKETSESTESVEHITSKKPSEYKPVTYIDTTSFEMKPEFEITTPVFHSTTFKQPKPSENNVEPLINEGNKQEITAPDLEVSWQEPQEVVWTAIPNEKPALEIVGTTGSPMSTDLPSFTTLSIKVKPQSNFVVSNGEKTTTESAASNEVKLVTIADFIKPEASTNNMQYTVSTGSSKVSTTTQKITAAPLVNKDSYTTQRVTTKPVDNNNPSTTTQRITPQINNNRAPSNTQRITTAPLFNRAPVSNQKITASPIINKVPASLYASLFDSTNSESESNSEEEMELVSSSKPGDQKSSTLPIIPFSQENHYTPSAFYSERHTAQTKLVSDLETTERNRIPNYGDKDATHTKLVADFDGPSEEMELISSSNPEDDMPSTPPIRPVMQEKYYTPEVALEPASSSNLGLEATTTSLDEDIRRFIDLNNDVAIRMFKHVTSEHDKRRSIALSPFGATSLLAMVFLGARGQTSAQMNDFLPFDDMITFNPHLVMRNITDSVIMSPDLQAAAIVRQLYSQEVMTASGKLLDFYKARAGAFYDGLVQEVDFEVFSEIVRQHTNELVGTQTSEVVPEFLSKTANLRLRPPLAALSSNVFQMNCKQAASQSRTPDLQFTGDRPSMVHTLFSSVWTGQFLVGYDAGLDATAVEIPHSSSPGGALTSTVFIMPGRPGSRSGTPLLARLEARLISRRAWSGLLRNLVRSKSVIDVQIPRFEHRSVLNLTVPLRRMGLKDLFTPGVADLRGVNGIQDLYLTDVMQVNAFSVCSDANAEGHVETYPTSRRTGRVGGRGGEDDEEDEKDWRREYYNLPLALRPRQARIPTASDVPRLRLDRPFLYVVRHNPTGMILHMGRFNPRFNS